MNMVKTLADVRTLTRLVTGWCVEQDDIAGFYVGLGGTPSCPVLRVVTYWPDDRKAAKDYPLSPESRDDHAFDDLEALAREARARAVWVAACEAARDAREAVGVDVDGAALEGAVGDLAADHLQHRVGEILPGRDPV
jgi:hypothetical protein